MTTADILELENKAREKRSKFEVVKSIPILAWFLWIFIGTLFYAVHDEFGFVYGLYQSVNIGWSIGWTTPADSIHFNGTGSRMFSTVHTSIGVVFVGIAVMYMARQMSENQDSWIIDVIRRHQVKAAAETAGYSDDVKAWLVYYLPKYKIIVLFAVWIIFGMMWGMMSVNEWGWFHAFDFVLSTLSGAGYSSLPESSPQWHYVVVALYTATGVPITAIAIGMLLSFVLLTNDMTMYDKIMTPVSDRELEFMRIFGIDDGDGTLDNREFIILTVVRIGAATPLLISQINERFKELDRKHEGKIYYDDIVFGRKKRTAVRKFKYLVKKSAVESSLAYKAQSHQSSRVGIFNSSNKVHAESKANPVLDTTVCNSDGNERKVDVEEFPSVQCLSGCSQNFSANKLADTVQLVSFKKNSPSKRDVLLERKDIPSDKPKVSSVISLKSNVIDDDLSLFLKCVVAGRRFFFLALSYLVDPYALSFISWVTWLAVGTLFFSIHDDLFLSKAFFTSVSFGYGIFWTPIPHNLASSIFVRVHFAVGVAAIGGIMAVFAKSLADAKSKWYVDAMKKQAMEAARKTEGYWDDIVASIEYYGPKFQIHILFILWFAVGVLWGWVCVDWPLLNGVYFSMSAMATGGLWPIPDDSPEWHFLFGGIYVVVGVPVMAISFGLMANSVSSIGGSLSLEEKIGARVTDQELDMMKEFGIENGDGAIDAREYVILVLVRIGALAPELISTINQAFQKLDKKGSGFITYEDLQEVDNDHVASELAQNTNHHTGSNLRKFGFIKSDKIFL
eukprot:CAMPEP_0185020120 /NCGR_PEP_ID=MMETSP1103-20130426/2725_1 /TAXON_ID=36769 /ORGANISM="Paraphysomonas bandaiensis, Strain Caron Lab Isolate" /LENGTH=787 /DNA_ID=CAMNT_0027550835 /DNA_START=268 /DNA_END=2631 /DNA_ORIENTATION=-